MSSGPLVITSAFQSSDCHGAPFWRVCFGGETPDRYVCRECLNECIPAREKVLADLQAENTRLRGWVW